MLPIQEPCIDTSEISVFRFVNWTTGTAVQYWLKSRLSSWLAWRGNDNFFIYFMKRFMNGLTLWLLYLYDAKEMLRHTIVERVTSSHDSNTIYIMENDLLFDNKTYLYSAFPWSNSSRILWNSLLVTTFLLW